MGLIGLAGATLAGATALAAGQINPASPAVSRPAPALGLGLGEPSPSVRGLHLDVAPTPSTDIALPGKPFILRADVTPKRGVHVYAPGNTSYTPVSLTIDPQTGIVSGEQKYPKSLELFFAPLKERVQVFSSAFRLEREVTVMPAATALALTNPTLTIKGTLAYQACDDKVCYLPQTLPLTWTVAIKR